jgi:hypothetical protein
LTNFGRLRESASLIPVLHSFSGDEPTHGMNQCKSHKTELRNRGEAIERRDNVDIRIHRDGLFKPNSLKDLIGQARAEEYDVQREKLA